MLTFLQFLEMVGKHTDEQIALRLKSVPHLIPIIETLTKNADDMYKFLNISLAVHLYEFPYIISDQFGVITTQNLEQYLNNSRDAKSHGNMWFCVIRAGLPESTVVTSYARRSGSLGIKTEPIYFKVPNYQQLRMKEKLNRISQVNDAKGFDVDYVISKSEFNADKIAFAKDPISFPTNKRNLILAKIGKV